MGEGWKSYFPLRTSIVGHICRNASNFLRCTVYCILKFLVGIDLNWLAQVYGYFMMVSSYFQYAITLAILVLMEIIGGVVAAVRKDDVSWLLVTHHLTIVTHHLTIQVAALFETSARATFDGYTTNPNNKLVWDNFQIAVSNYNLTCHLFHTNQLLYPNWKLLLWGVTYAKCF